MTRPPRLALVRPPGDDLERGERSFIARAAIDPERAREQHAAYRRALAGLGFDVRVLEPLPGQPDAVFVEDPLLLLDGVAVCTRPGAESRRPEVERLAAELAAVPELARLTVERIADPGTLEGGDVLAIDDVLLVGQSTRTNHAGLKQLAHLSLAWGYRVKAAAVEGCLHLKTACSWLGRGTLLANPAWVDLGRSPASEIVPVDPREPFAANAIAVEGKVLMSASWPRTAERVAVRGFDVVTVELDELEKAEGGPTCLSVRVERRGE